MSIRTSSPLVTSVYLAFALSGVSTACSLEGDGPAMTGGQTGDEFDKIMQELNGEDPRIDPMGPKVGDASVELSKFAWGFYGQVAAPSENFVYSPYSLATAAAMLYAGAAGETASQMQEVFEFSDEGAPFHQSRNDLLQYLDARNIAKTEKRDAQVLKVSNDFWMAESLTPAPDFLNVLSAYYGAPVHLFNGTPEDVRLAINGKVSDDTNTLIDELLPEGSIGESTIFVLTNALYFKAPWAHAFAATETVDADFTLNDGRTATVELMHASEARGGYAEDAGTQVLAMPYFGGELEFVALMPEAGSFDTFAAGLNNESVNALTSNLTSTVLDLRFPKMEVEHELSLAKELKEAGMVDAFSGEADFSKLSGGIILTGAFHQTKLILDEKGTEAAAATAFLGNDSAVPTPVEVTFDRPFVFFVRDIETQAVLFVGHFSVPE